MMTSSNVYLPGQQVTITGFTQSNLTLDISIQDPSAQITQESQVTSDEQGNFSYQFELPQFAQMGMWKIKASTSTDFFELEFSVIDNYSESHSQIRTKVLDNIQNFTFDYSVPLDPNCMPRPKQSYSEGHLIQDTLDPNITLDKIKESNLQILQNQNSNQTTLKINLYDKQGNIIPHVGFFFNVTKNDITVSKLFLQSSSGVLSILLNPDDSKPEWSTNETSRNSHSGALESEDGSFVVSVPRNFVEKYFIDTTVFVAFYDTNLLLSDCAPKFSWIMTHDHGKYEIDQTTDVSKNSIYCGDSVTPLYGCNETRTIEINSPPVIISQVELWGPESFSVNNINACAFGNTSLGPWAVGWIELYNTQNETTTISDVLLSSSSWNMGWEPITLEPHQYCYIGTQDKLSTRIGIGGSLGNAPPPHNDVITTLKYSVKETPYVYSTISLTDDFADTRTWQLIDGKWIFGEADIKSSLTKLESPLKQFKLGIPLDKIQCKEGKHLIIRTDEQPYCVKLETMPELFKRGIGFLSNNHPYSPFPDHN